MDAAIAKLTPENVKLALTYLYALAGAAKALGLGNKAFASDFKLPAFVAVGAGVAELAGAAMLHKGGEFLAHGVLLLVMMMGGAIVAHLRTAPAAALFPASCTYGLWYVLAASKQAQPPLFAAAIAAGVLGNLVLTASGKAGKKAAAGKKATAKKAK